MTAATTSAGVPVSPAPRLLDECLRAATLAPSSHNTQPWRFRLIGENIDLIADRTRALPANDPFDRELTISCGAALFNLRAAAAARSRVALVDEFPFPDDEDLLARVTLCTGLQSDIPNAASLDAVIDKRRTYRKRFLDEAVDQTTIDSLVLAAECEQCLASPIAGPTQRERAAELIAEADETLWNDATWRREISSWMHPQRKNEGFLIPGLSQRAAQIVVRSFDLGSGVAARDQQILEGTPLLLVIGTPADEVADWLRAGQALERILLTACAAGLQASFLNQPIHVDRLRTRLRDLAPRALVPQVLLRLGKPAEVLAPVVRRPLTDVSGGVLIES